MNDDCGTERGIRAPTGNLADEKLDELARVRHAIVANARRTVDPDGTGFDATMQSSDDGSFFFTDDWFVAWGDRVINVLSVITQRISLAVLSAGFAIAGANMINTAPSVGYGRASLVASGLLGGWVVVAGLLGTRR